MFLLVTEGQALFYIFILFLAIALWLGAFILKNRSIQIAFTLLSSMTFIYLGFELATETIILLVFIGIVIIQIITLILTRGKE